MVGFQDWRRSPQTRETRVMTGSKGSAAVSGTISDDDCREGIVAVENALLQAILVHGTSCLSQVSMRTGYGISLLRKAAKNLVKKNLIRSVRHKGRRTSDFDSYEIVS
jgi:hypothetical protein